LEQKAGKFARRIRWIMFRRNSDTRKFFMDDNATLQNRNNSLEGQVKKTTVSRWMFSALGRQRCSLYRPQHLFGGLNIRAIR
jgi:hypothetical protein